ncbi:MAG TPA: M20/M25/M40 family metallo-hydrolase [Clostridiaceae bacterium]|nr:M20/M25/M40 family metallo-hydrolase [Clostridiaceae bacterium]
MQNNAIIEEFIELTSINSPSRGERRMADILKKKLTEIGCDVYEDDTAGKIGGTAGNVIGILRGKVGKPVILAAHMDRVANGDNIRHVVTNEKITSDGTTILAADDVSGIVSILEGLRRIKESGEEHCNVEVVFTVCEEDSIKGSEFLNYDLLTAKHCYCLDSPGRIGRIINAAPYKVKLFINVYGKTAHAGQAPEKGINALKIAAKVLSDIEEGRIDSETTANWALITAGKTTNVVCDYVRIGGEARSHNPNKLGQYISYVKQHCEEVISGTGAKFEVQTEFCFEGFEIPEEDDLIVTLKDVLSDIGIDAYVQGGGGGMDANRFNSKGIKSIGVATGYLNNHSTYEEIYINDLIKAGEMVAGLIRYYSRK